MAWQVYLSGEIHTDWREKIVQGAKALPAGFSSPVTNHEASDAAGDLLGPVSEGYWRDHKSARVNSIRTRAMIEHCDIAVIRFGNQYKQWNAAFDAGICSALGKPYITLHDEDLIHPLKEVDAAAMAWATTPAEVVEIFRYVMTQD